MKKVSIPAYTVLVLILTVCCILLVGSFSLSANSAYAADDNVPADAVISIIDGETVTYYSSFAAAIGNVKDGVTLRYLQDGETNTFSLGGSSGIDFTIDLNGKTVDFAPSITQIKTLTLRDDSAEKTGTLVLDPNAATQFYADERLTFENITVKSGAILLEKVPITNVNGGRIESIVIASEYSYVNMTDGYIKNLRVDNQSNVSGGTIELFEVQTTNPILSGGTIRSFMLAKGATFDSILCSGYAYQSESGELLKPSEMTESTAVNIVKCTHESFTLADGKYVCDYCGEVCKHTDYDETTGICNACSAPVVAKIIDGETAEETVYTSFSEAVNDAPDASSDKKVTIKLLQRADFCNIENKSLTIDLNGKTLYCNDSSMNFTSSTVSILDSSAAQSGEVSVNYSLTFENCNATISSGNFYGRDTSNENDQPYVNFVEGTTEISGGNFVLWFIPASDSKVTITAGTFGCLHVVNAGETDNFLKISNANISSLYVSYLKPTFKENVEVKASKTFGISDFTGLLHEGYAYTDAETQEYIKSSEVTESTHFKTVACTHPSFDNSQGEYICDYCGFVCHHTTYDGDECSVCKRVCPHDGADETNRNCADCGGTIKVKVTNDSGTKFYVDFDFATKQLIDGDYMTILADIVLDYRKDNTIDKNVTLDLNGCKLTMIYLRIYSAVTIINRTDKDSSLSFVSLSGADIIVYGNPNTKLTIMAHVNNSIKIYGGIIVGFQGGAASPSVFLPDGYVYRYFDGTESRLITKDAADKLSFIGNTNEYLAVEKCNHPVINSDLTCNYCGMHLGDALVEINEELETAKNNLQAAIDEKADINTLNERVKELNDAIAKAEAAAKKYADQKDTALKEDLENQISTAKGNLETLITQAKNDAISSAKSDLEKAKSNLQAAIDEKADINTLNEKVKELNEAIAKAETAKAYADQKDTELREDLENQIKTAKGNLESMITEAKNDAVNSANSALDGAKSELTAKIATKADANEVSKAIESLNAAIANAETANNAYTNANNAAVKAELTKNIADSKAEINAAIEALSKRLKDVENKTDSLNDRLSASENKSNTLQTVLIVFIVLLSLANVATVVTFSLRKRK